MHVQPGRPFRIPLNDNRYLDISMYPHKWKMDVYMSVWEEGKSSAISMNRKSYLALNKVFGQKRAEEWLTKRLNQQSQQIAGVSVITKS